MFRGAEQVQLYLIGYSAERTLHFFNSVTLKVSRIIDLIHSVPVIIILFPLALIVGDDKLLSTTYLVKPSTHACMTM
jgi:hypothetical protein